MRQRTFLSLISIFLLMGSAYADDNINTVINQDPIANRIVNYSLDSTYRLPYLAVTSKEVSGLVGLWQSDNDEKKLVPYILKRAVSICAQDNGELVDFEIETTDDNGRFVVLDDKSKRVTNGDDRWSKSWSKPSITANLDSLGVDLILEKIKKLSLKGAMYFRHVHFKKIICVNSKNLTKKQIGVQKLKYHCPKFDTTKPYCDKFKSFGQFQCFRYGKKSRNYTGKSVKVCEKITNNAQATCVNSALESRSKPSLKYATEHCSRISTPYQEMAVMKALEKFDLKDSVNQVLKLKTDEQAQVATKAMNKLNPDLAVKVALEIENKAQAKFAIKAMDHDIPRDAVRKALKIKTDIQAIAGIAMMNNGFYPQYAVEEALKIKLENKTQEKFAIKAMAGWPQTAAKIALKIKTDIQANLGIEIMNNGYSPQHALKLALKVTNSHHAETAINFMNKLNSPSYSIIISSSISQAFQENVAAKVFNKGYPAPYAIKQAMLIENEFQSKVAVRAMEQWEPDLAVEVALKISTSEQAARALQGMNKNKWDPGYAVQKALE